MSSYLIIRVFLLIIRVFLFDEFLFDNMSSYLIIRVFRFENTSVPFDNAIVRPKPREM